MSSKEMEDQNINERDKQVSNSGIKTTVCFNRGIGAPFYMFSKHLEDGECLREWKNPDPTGDLPITMQYCYVIPHEGVEKYDKEFRNRANSIN
jgi:hypothetical protein